jgi:hypothetical protein
MMRVSPNAVKGSFRVAYPWTTFRGGLTAKLLKADGEVLDTPVEIRMTQEDVADVLILEPKPGIFYLRIGDGKTSVMKKIIIQ